MKVKIIKENKQYQYSFYKKDELWDVHFEFDEYYVATINSSHSKAIKKTDCEVIID